MQVLETELWISEYMLFTAEPSLQTLSFCLFFSTDIFQICGTFFCLLFLIFSRGPAFAFRGQRGCQIENVMLVLETKPELFSTRAEGTLDP